MILVVHLKGPTPETNRSLKFVESPVRVGRNQLNDVPLDDPFVSEWHGIIRFGDQGVAYFDLDSKNGSILDGQRVPKNTPAKLSEASRLQIGRTELSVVPQQPPEPARSSSDTGPRKTLAWGVMPDPASTPAPPVRSGRAVAGGSASRGGAAAAAASHSSASPTPAPASAENAALAARYKTLLETFAEAFVGLRKGYEQFGAEVGVRTISGRTTLHRARSAREVAEYLLDPHVDPTAAARDLIAIFADFGIHHIAMMEAVTEGVRAFVQSLDPRQNGLDAGSGLWSAGKKKSQWKEYTERFDQAASDDQELHAAIFGVEFARAYARVTGGDGGGGENKPPERDRDRGRDRDFEGDSSRGRRR